MCDLDIQLMPKRGNPLGGDDAARRRLGNNQQMLHVAGRAPAEMLHSRLVVDDDVAVVAADRADDLAQIKAQSPAGTFWRGLGLAVINPKTLLFNAAFLPQFVAGTNGAANELFMLATIFLSVIVVGDAMWAVFAASARNWLNKYGNLRNKVTGGFLFGAGIGLAFSRRNF